jgi:hypothetical protein
MRRFDILDFSTTMRYQVELEPKIQTSIPSAELSLETYRNLIKSGSIEQKIDLETAQKVSQPWKK